jgi:hypothetical protein
MQSDLSPRNKLRIIHSRIKDKEIASLILSSLVTTSAVQSDSDFIPPLAVRKAAQRGLAMRDAAPKSKKGGLSPKEAAKQGIGSGVTRARQLSSGKKVSLATLKRMVSFFARHEANYKKGGPKAVIAWLLWGGNPGKAWANRIVKKYSK